MNVQQKPSKLIKGATGDWEVVIGMEVHAQVTSKSKLFSGASTAFGGAPNSHVSLIDAAMPGMLPVINEECVRQAVRTGLGLKAKINLRSVFDRKNYFYPDLPQGYQISQYKQPVVGEGEVVVDLSNGEAVTVGIRPEHFVEAGAAPVQLLARAQVVEQLGGVSYVYAASESGAQITVQQRGHSQMANGAAVEFGVDPATVLMFDAEGQRL